jgi:long-chain fatty acid transport protein
MSFLYRFLFFEALCFLLFATSVWGAGLVLYEQGTPDLGTAAAGRAALAKDASTAGGNPAGMTRLDRSQLLASVMPLLVRAKFDVDNRTTHSGGNGGDAGDLVMAASAFYVHSLTENLKLGIAAGSYFGLGLDYGNKWAGRYYVQDAELLTIAINPVIAYRINEWFSIGGGFSIVKSNLIQRIGVNNLLPFLSDGQIKVEDDDVGFGGNVGILVEPRDGTRFGLTYRSKVELDFKDVASLRGIGPLLNAALTRSGLAGSKADLEMNIPQMVMFSGYHELTDRFAVMGNIGWQKQSEFGKTNVSISSTNSKSFTADRNFDDTWHFAVGLQYRIKEPWLFSLGFAYDKSPVDDDDRTPDMPVDRQLRYGTGIQYEWNKDITLGFAYEYLDAGDADINQNKGPLAGRLVGDYKTNEIHFFAFNINWKF